MTTDTLTLTTCSCAAYTWFGETTAVYRDGITHGPEDCGAGL